ncbi:MAG: hypothetical protein PHY44_08030 [Lachnospiraceae bacterium]|nr:hypothetical protein [Lachnospiraceae bacterium]
MEKGSIMSGQIAGLVTKEQTAKEILDELYTEYKAIIKNTERP